MRASGLACTRAIRYGWPPMAERLDLDVYPTDGEAIEAAAERAAEHLRAAATSAPLRVALSGGRSGRGLLVALAGIDDLPWERIDWLWADERCVAATEPQSNVRLARDSLLEPRAIPAERIYPPPVELNDPARIAAAYAETLVALGGGPTPILDLVLLGLGPSGAVAALMPGGAALAATAPVTAVPPVEVTEEPPLARITMTPPVLRAARHIVVVATGDAQAAAVAAAMGDPVDPSRVPAHAVRPCARVAWCLDRAAAKELLRGARPTQ